MRDSETEFLVLLSGFDETFSATVHTRTSFTHAEILWGYRFANVFQVSGGGGQKVAVDMKQFDAVESAHLALER